jgi:hypothetical protein
VFTVEADPDRSLRAAVAGNFVLAAGLSLVASAGLIGEAWRGWQTLAPAGPGGPATALRLAGLLAGPLTLGALAAALAWAVAPVAERRFLWSAAAACAVAPAILGYGMVGELHDHVLLAVAAAMTLGWALRLVLGGGTAAGVGLGGWVAAGIWLSPEILPFGLLAFGGVVLAWLLAPATPGLRGGIAAAGSALVAVLAVAWLADPPPGGRLAADIGRISVVYLAFGVACCGAGWAIAGLGRTAGTAVAALCLLAWLAAFPAVASGAAAIATTAQVHAVLAHLRAMRPVRGLGYVAACLAGGAAAIGLLGWLAWRRHSVLLAYALLCGLLIVAQGALHQRLATYAAALAVGLLPVTLTMVARLPARRGAPVLALARAGLIGCIVLLPWLHLFGAGPTGNPLIGMLR